MIPRITAHGSPMGEFIRIEQCNLLPEEIGLMIAELESAKARCQIMAHERIGQFRHHATTGNWSGIDWVPAADDATTDD